MKKLIPFLLFVVACGSEETEEVTQDDSVIVEDTLQLDTLPEPAPESIQLPEIDFDKTYEANILMTGTYHEYEVMGDVEELEWWGVYRRLANGLEISEAKLSGNRVYDAILDADGDATGWEISDMSGEDAIFYVSGLDYLIAMDSEELSLKDYTIYPDEEEDFYYGEGTITLFAEGESEKIDEDYAIVSDYKLFAKAIIEGEELTQLLIEYSGFDDAMVSVSFVGDIDGDGIPDLLTNNTYHYNISMPTLYLSRPATEGNLYKLVAAHPTTGC